MLEDDILNDDTTVPVPVKASAAPQQPVSRPIAQAAVKPAQAKPITAQAQSNKLTERKEANIIEATDNTVKSKLAEVEKLTPEERMKKRAEKFGGAVNLDVKKQMRAERFGLASGNKSTVVSGTTGKTAVNADDVDRLKKRAERFGAVTSTSLSKVDQDERKRKRAERFGTSVTTSAKTISLNSTDSDLEAKKKKRAERFGIKT